MTTLRFGSCLIALLLLQAGAAWAATPIVRSRIAPTEVVVGEEVRLVVEVIVPTWLLGAPHLPELEIGGVVVVASGESGLNLTESVGGVTWSGVSNEYVLYPQRAGAFETPAASVGVTYSVDGRSVSAEMPIPVQRFAARLPPGVEAGDRVLVASGLELTQDVEPRPEGLLVGDALRRTIRIRAQKTRAMLLAEIGAAPIDGLSPYSDTPRLVDTPGRRGAEPTAERVESTSWILERPGSYALPAVTVRWWNVVDQRMETASLSAVEFRVAPNASVDAAMGPDRGWWLVGIVAAVAVGLFVLAARRGWLAAGRRGALACLERARRSERAYFGAFVRATQRGEPRAILAAFFAWLDRRARADGTATVESFVAESESPELGREISSLEASLFAAQETRRRADGTWSPAALRRNAVVARARAAESSNDEPSPLGPLNP